MSSHADNLSSLGEDLSWFKIIRLYSNIAIFLKMADQERMISKIEVDVEVACDDCPTASSTSRPSSQQRCCSSSH